MCPEDAARFPSRFRQRRLGISDEFEITLLPARGGELRVRVAASPIIDEDGRFKGALAMVTDISAEREAERRRDAAQEKMRRALARERRTVEATVRALARTVELRDPYTAGHQERVAALAGAMAEKLGLPRRRIVALGIAATIHDLGKMSVPAEILSKPGLLSESERRLLEQHPVVGYEILREMPFQGPVADIVRGHHERLDGSGYPRGLRDSEIRLEARILAVADVVEAMSAHRPYRPALGVQAALEEITAQRGTLYEAAAVDACVKLFRQDGFQLS
jgi:putative nucleotidyltransferase with HDIG domain